MAAARTQKRASASAGKTATKGRSTSRASTSRTTRSATTTRSTSSSARTHHAARTGPARAARTRPGTSRTPRRQSSTGSARVTVLAVIVALVLAAWWVYPTFKLQYEHQREVETLENELDDLKSRNEELRDEVDGLKTPEGVEQLARESLGLAKPGEQVYVVTGSVTPESTSTVDAAAGDEQPLWQRALDALFGLD